MLALLPGGPLNDGTIGSELRAPALAALSWAHLRLRDANDGSSELVSVSPVTTRSSRPLLEPVLRSDHRRSAAKGVGTNQISLK